MSKPNTAFRQDQNRKSTVNVEKHFYVKEEALKFKKSLKESGQYDMVRMTSSKVGARPWKGNNFTQKYMYTVRSYNN
jgi:hypothetical protein